MKTIGSFSTPEEAHLVRCRLEAAGIPAFIRDEFTIQLYWLYSTALGGVRVDVPDDRVEDARALVWSEPGEDAGIASHQCPRCGSGRVTNIEWPRRVAYLSLLLFWFPVLLSGKRQRCEGCSLRWR
jgi:hypothetical protein